MQIKNNSIQKINIQPVKIQQNSTPAQTQSFGSTTSLPNVYASGESLVNTNAPISYTKIGEVEIPGLKDKASIFKLANGQKVVIAPKKGPTYIKTTYNVGAMNETEDIKGISHYIEHNLFNGSKSLAPKEYDRRLSELGGGTNASTGYCATDYYLTLQLIKDNSLEEAIRLNAMQTQFPTFPVEQLEKEKEAVKSEIDVYKDKPDNLAINTVLKNLFGITTAADDIVLGTKDSINSLNREKVLDYYNTWYTPDNAVTVITGDVDVDETMQLVSKYYNKQPDLSHVNNRQNYQITYTDKPVRTDIIPSNATCAYAKMGFAVPEGTSQLDIDKIETLLSILNSSNSRLSKTLDKSGLYAYFGTDKIQNKPDGARVIMAESSAPEEKIEDVIKILYEEITYIANNPPSQKELENAKNKAIDELNELTESSGGTNALLTKMSMLNNFNYVNESISNIQSITPQDISETARKFLDLNKVSLCVAHENTATADSINAGFNNSTNAPKMVSFGKSQSPKASMSEEVSKIKQFRLANNLETMIMAGNENGRSVLGINFDTDEINDATNPALTVLEILLNRGSLYRNNEAYNNILNDKNAALYFGTSADGISINSSFNDKDTAEILALAKETLSAPNFTQSEFDRAKEIVKDFLLTESASATSNLLTEIYPDLETFASKEDRIKQLESLTLQDVQSLYSKILSTSRANASFVAPVESKPYLQDIVHNELSTGLPTFKPFDSKKSESYHIYSQNTKTKVIAQVQEQAQADIAQAYTYKKTRNIDDIAKIELLDIILSGSMSSRLFLDLREDKKLAYGVGTDMFNEKDSSAIIFYINTTTDSPDPKEGSPKNAILALEGFERNVNLLRNENVSEQELEQAKILYKTSILNKIETNYAKNSIASASKYSAYNIHHYEQLLDAIDRITPDDIRAAANYVFQNPPITSIVASQKTLDALNL